MRTVWDDGAGEKSVTAPLSLIVIRLRSGAAMYAPSALTPELRRDSGDTRAAADRPRGGPMSPGGFGPGSGLRRRGERAARSRRPHAAARLLRAIQELERRREDARLPRPLGRRPLRDPRRDGVRRGLRARRRTGRNRAERLAGPLQRGTGRGDPGRERTTSKPCEARTASARASRAPSSIASAARATTTCCASAARATKSSPQSARELRALWSETTHRMQALPRRPRLRGRGTGEPLRREEPRPLGPLSPSRSTTTCAAPFVASGVRPRMAILREQGVNGQVEMAAAFHRAGFECVDVHMSDLAGIAGLSSRLQGTGGVRRLLLRRRARRRRGLGQVDPVQSRAVRDQFAAFFAAPRQLRPGGLQRLPDALESARADPGGRAAGPASCATAPSSSRRGSRWWRCGQPLDPAAAAWRAPVSRSRWPTARGGRSSRPRCNAGRVERGAAGGSASSTTIGGAATEHYPENPNGSPEGITGAHDARRPGHHHDAPPRARLSNRAALLVPERVGRGRPVDATVPKRARLGGLKRASRRRSGGEPLEHGLMEHSSLTAISPVDGRYGRQVAELRGIFSEFGLIRYRVASRIAGCSSSPDTPASRGPRALGGGQRVPRRHRRRASTKPPAKRVKEIERTTNHDVKAVEYFLKERIADQPELEKASPSSSTSPAPPRTSTTSPTALMLAGRPGALPAARDGRGDRGDPALAEEHADDRCSPAPTASPPRPPPSARRWRTSSRASPASASSWPR